MLYIILHRLSTGSSFLKEANAWFLIIIIFIIIIIIFIYWVLFYSMVSGRGATLGRIGTHFQKSSTEIDYRESSVFLRPNASQRPSYSKISIVDFLNQCYKLV